MNILLLLLLVKVNLQSVLVKLKALGKKYPLIHATNKYYQIIIHIVPYKPIGS